MSAKGLSASIFAAFAASAAFAMPAAAQEPLQLKLAHFMPTENGMHKDFMEPWARELESCSGNAVKVTVFPGGAELSNPAKIYDSTRAGVVDIAQGLAGIPGGRFERTRIAEMPFVFDSAGQATRTLWALYPKYLKDEYPGVKILALHAHNPGQIHTTKKRVSKPEDLNGLRLRFPTAATAAMVKALGATPVGLPPGAVYENAEKGVIDGAVFPWDTMDSFKLGELMKFHLDLNSYVTVFWFGINQNRYDTLPEKVKACIDKTSGDALVAKFGDWWTKWDEKGYKIVQGPGHEIVKPNEAERQAWRQKLDPMATEFLADLQKKGIDNAPEIYKAMKDKAAEFKK